MPFITAKLSERVLRLFSCATLIFVTMTTTAQLNSIYEHTFIDIDGNEIELKQFEGKKILFVNVASECGFTSQYHRLQELHEQQGEGLTIIGFPCNQFGGQEPGTEEDIKSFCTKNFGVSFLMASKIKVKGEGQSPIYKWLTSKESNGVEDSVVRWNFQKYLVDEKGNYLKMYKSPSFPKEKDIVDKKKINSK